VLKSTGGEVFVLERSARGEPETLVSEGRVVTETLGDPVSDPAKAAPRVLFDRMFHVSAGLSIFSIVAKPETGIGDVTGMKYDLSGRPVHLSTGSFYGDISVRLPARLSRLALGLSIGIARVNTSDLYPSDVDQNGSYVYPKTRNVWNVLGTMYLDYRVKRTRGGYFVIGVQRQALKPAVPVDIPGGLLEREYASQMGQTFLPSVRLIFERGDGDSRIRKRFGVFAGPQSIGFLVDLGLGFGRTKRSGR
jgi:hypothetical protein